MRQVPKNIGVIELDAGQYRQVGSEVKELGSLVEKGRVVFVPLYDDVLPCSQAIVAVEIL